jgi:hypothetical protein
MTERPRSLTVSSVAPHTDPTADVITSPEALVQGLRTAFGVVVPALALTWAYLGRSIVRWTLALRTRVRESAMF